MWPARCLSYAALLFGAGVAHAGDRLPDAIAFDGHCDGITDIRFIPHRGTAGGAQITGSSDRSACGLPSAPANSGTGSFFTVFNTTGTYGIQRRLPR
jgi:hypothetical protein